MSYFVVNMSIGKKEGGGKKKSINGQILRQRSFSHSLRCNQDETKYLGSEFHIENYLVSDNTTSILLINEIT